MKNKQELKIHKRRNNYIIGTLTECGIYVLKEQSTEDIRKTTCKNCIRLFNRRNQKISFFSKIRNWIINFWS